VAVKLDCEIMDTMHTWLKEIDLALLCNKP
jgi:hypothetical protein